MPAPKDPIKYALWKKHVGDAGKGKKRSAETKKRMIEAALNKPPITDITRNKMRESQKNRPPITEETRKKISENSKNRDPEIMKKVHISNRGKKRSEESRKRMSDAQKKNRYMVGKPAWNKGLPSTWTKGIPRTEEIKQKISIANKGKPKSEETKQKLKNAAKNRPPVTEETKKKMSISRKKRPHHTEETKKKIGLSHLGKKCSKETKLKISISHSGEKNHGFGKPIHPNARKGIINYNKTRILSEQTIIKQIEPHIEGGFWYGNVKYSVGIVYCGKFTPAFREGVRKLQNYTCMECGHVWQPGERKLSVHHVYYNKKSCCTQNEDGQYIQTIPSGESKGMKILVEGNPNKFAALCSIKGDKGCCHSKTNHNRLYYAKRYEKIINEQYEGLSYIPTEKLKNTVKS